MKKNAVIIILAVVIVGAVGYVALIKKPATDGTTIQPSPSAADQTPAPIDESNWKTYRNEELGFEFKYPGDWQISRPSESEPSSPPGVGSGGFESFNILTPNQSFDSAVGFVRGPTSLTDLRYQGSPQLCEGISVQEIITINGKPALMCIQAEVSFRRVYILDIGSPYSILYSFNQQLGDEIEKIAKSLVIFK